MTTEISIWRKFFIGLSIVWAVFLLSYMMEVMINDILDLGVSSYVFFAISMCSIGASIFIAYGAAGFIKRWSGKFAAGLLWLAGAGAWYLVFRTAFEEVGEGSYDIWEALVFAIIMLMLSDALLSQGRWWAWRLSGKPDEITEAYQKGWDDAMKRVGAQVPERRVYTREDRIDAESRYAHLEDTAINRAKALRVSMPIYCVCYGLYVFMFIVAITTYSHIISFAIFVTAITALFFPFITGRARDVDKPWYYAFWILVPALGLLKLLYLCWEPSKEGPLEES